MEGRLTTGRYFLGFTPLGDEKKLRPRYVKVFCDACVQCGNVQNIRVENADRLK